ncbi:MAG: hypothetical protein LBN09_03185 [Clostridioides sp.]|jgi:hypothetical protein|nr:hypothetical protein [Clostridioides sp.]
MSTRKEREEAAFAKAIGSIERPLSDFANDLSDQYIEGTIEVEEMVKKTMEKYTAN